MAHYDYYYEKYLSNSLSSTNSAINTTENKKFIKVSVEQEIIDDGNLPFIVFSEDKKVIAKTKTEEIARAIVDYHHNHENEWKIAKLS